jgi:hypothetical protein
MDEAWRQFEMSGKVTDYLKFKGMNGSLAFDCAQCGRDRPDGAESCIDRNGVKYHADWRI